jgi:hypothetical protein
MKREFEFARAREQRTSDLAAQARHARERFDLYRAKSYGPKLTSPGRLRDLERTRDLAESRLRLAQAGPDPEPDTELEPRSD